MNLGPTEALPAVWGALIICATSFSARTAFSEGVKITETAVFEWHADNLDQSDTNDNYFFIKNRLNLSFLRDPLESSLRLDTNTIFGYDLFDSGDPKAPPGRRYKDDYRLERLTAVLSPGGGFTLTLGDFYAQLGNGILLSLRKIDELGMETVLRGARIDLVSSGFSFGLLGGVTNTNNVDEQENYFYEDPMDRIAGAKLAISPVGRLRFEYFAMVMDWSEKRGWGKIPLWLLGQGISISAALVPGHLTFVLEGDLIWRERIKRVSLFEMGEAVYLKVSGAAGPLSVLVEGKWYENIDLTGSHLGGEPIAYNLPPTAERVDQESKNVTVFGGRTKIDLRLGDSFSVIGNVSAGDYAPLTDKIKGAETRGELYYIHLYGGFSMFTAEGLSQVTITGGWRTETGRGELPGEPRWVRRKHLYHIEAKLLFHLGGGWSIHYSLIHEDRGATRGGEYRDYVRGTQVLGLGLSGVMSLSAAFEYNTEFLRRPFRQNLYFWWEGKFYPTRRIVLSIKGGMEKGGLKCMSGVCKILPPFSGMKLSLVYRY